MRKVYKNIDFKYKDSPCELIMEIILRFPYSESLEKLLSVIKVWDMRLLQAGSMSPISKVAIKHEKFLKLYGDVPLIIGNVYPLKGTEAIASSLKLVGFIGNEEKKK